MPKSDANQGGNKHCPIGECTNTLIGETLSMAVLDSGCTKTICNKTWLNNVKHEQSGTTFKFGNGKICHSIEQITIQVVIAGLNVTYHRSNQK